MNTYDVKHNVYVVHTWVLRCLMATTPRRGRQTTRAYHHGDLRRSACAEAVRQIRARGFEALTLRGVAGELGVSQSALYRHFTNKSALLAAVGAEGFVTLRRELRLAWERAPGTFAGLDAMGEAYVRFAVAHPSHYRVMFDDVRTAGNVGTTVDGENTDAFSVLLEALTGLQRAGLVRSGDPHPLALHVWAQTHGIAMLALGGVLPTTDAALSLTRFSNARLQTGIAVAGEAGRARPTSASAPSAASRRSRDTRRRPARGR